MAILDQDQLKVLVAKMRTSGVFSGEELGKIDKFLEGLGELARKSSEIRSPIANSIYLCTEHGGYGFQSDCFVCNKEFGPNLTAWVELAEDMIKNDKLTGISGHNFVDSTRHRAVLNEDGSFQRDEAGNIVYNSRVAKANSTPVMYCLSMAKNANCAVEEMAAELIALHKAMREGRGTPVKECCRCLDFIPKAEMEEHLKSCVPLPGREDL